MKITKAQQVAIKRKFEQSNDEAKTYKEFRKRAMPTIGMDNAIVLPWHNMFLAIETDGYTHS